VVLDAVAEVYAAALTTKRTKRNEAASVGGLVIFQTEPLLLTLRDGE
jgi:hypothetical protein